MIGGEALTLSGSLELTEMRGRDTGFVWVTLRARFPMSRWESSGFLSERASQVGGRGSSGLEKMGRERETGIRENVFCFSLGGYHKNKRKN